jgi:hypothetical protein
MIAGSRLRGPENANRGQRLSSTIGMATLQEWAVMCEIVDAYADSLISAARTRSGNGRPARRSAWPSI